MVGWFYSKSNSILDSTDYNYTYLVLNVTITNHGYSQVNIISDNGFSILVNNFEYSTFSYIRVWLYNGTKTTSTYPTLQGYSFEKDLPTQGVLLNNGVVSGIVIFQCGDPNVYPQQPQILNKPFKLQYSVSYGDDYPLYVRLVYDLGPYAKVIIKESVS